MRSWDPGRHPRNPLGRFRRLPGVSMSAADTRRMLSAELLPDAAAVRVRPNDRSGYGPGVHTVRGGGPLRHAYLPVTVKDLAVMRRNGAIQHAETGSRPPMFTHPDAALAHLGHLRRKGRIRGGEPVVVAKVAVAKGGRWYTDRAVGAPATTVLSGADLPLHHVRRVSPAMLLGHDESARVMSAAEFLELRRRRERRKARLRTGAKAGAGFAASVAGAALHNAAVGALTRAAYRGMRLG